MAARTNFLTSMATLKAVKIFNQVALPTVFLCDRS